MKRAVSISLGSSKRNKAVEIDLLGERISIKRIGTDGDMEKAAQMYKELDGKVDAFGVGGADLGLLVDQKWYPLHSVKPMVRFVEKTPIVDGTGLKTKLENRMLSVFMKLHADYIKEKNVLITLGADRWGMTQSFVDADWNCIFGDLMFGLGFPVPLKSAKAVKVFAAALLPIAGRLPFHWIYPTGEKQEVRDPKFGKQYQWAEVIAGDCHYIKRHFPLKADGKVIFTNTTTPEDIKMFKESGVKYIVTATPILDGRSFGTNMIEAALIAVSGKQRTLTYDELDEMIDEMNFEPQIQELN